MRHNSSLGDPRYQALVRDADLYDVQIFEAEEFKGNSEPVDAVYAYWREKCRDGELPRRSDIRPEELRRYLPYLVLMDVSPDPEAKHGLRLVVRLIGTHVSTYYGELTGEEVVNMGNSAASERIYYMSRLTVGRRRSVFGLVKGIAPGHEHLTSYALYAPLRAEDSDRIDKILICATVEFSKAEH